MSSSSPLGCGVFAFVAISAGALLIIASPSVFEWYRRSLLEDRNYGRWIEYFFGSSVMIVLISNIIGVSEIAALLAIFGVNAAMTLFGLLVEKYETRGRPNMIAFRFGCFAGALSVFAVDMWLQYRQIGPWRDCLVARKSASPSV